MAATKPIRVIAKNTALRNLATVNIVTTQGPHTKVHSQLAGGAQLTGVHSTVMDSAGTVKGLRTICIPGYSAPS